MKVLIATVALVAIIALAQPAPDVLYSVNPNPTNKASQIATCPPTVAGVNGAFVCYHTSTGQGETVQYVNPSNQAVGVQSAIPYAQFVFPPLAVSNLTAIAYTADPTSSFYAVFSSNSVSLHDINRLGSTALVTYDPTLRMSYVPIGVNTTTNTDSIYAYDMTKAGNGGLVWSRNFAMPRGYTGTTQLSTPIAYNGKVIFTQNQTFRVHNGTNGFLMRASTNPCNFTGKNIVQMTVINIGQDANGPLDAFLMIAQTLTPTGDPQLSICRVSHNTAVMKWVANYPQSITVEDVVGSNNTVFLSGKLKSGGIVQYVVWSLDATTGMHHGMVYRNAQDQYSFPAVLAQPVSGCSETVVMQVRGNLTAFCTGQYDNPVWISPYSCNHRAAVDPASNVMACVSRGSSVHLVDNDGTLVWINPRISAMFAAQIVSGVVWVVDLDVTLWGLSIRPSATPLPPPYVPQGGTGGGDQGLSGGSVTGIVFAVFIVGGLIGAGTIFYIRRSKRRSAYAATTAVNERTDGGYGSLTGDA